MWKKLLKEVLQDQQENRLYKDVEINLIRQYKYIKTYVTPHNVITYELNIAKC